MTRSKTQSSHTFIKSALLASGETLAISAVSSNQVTGKMQVRWVR